MTDLTINHNFKEKIDLLLNEEGTLVAHYKNERIYKSHKIYATPKGWVIRFKLLKTE